MSDDNGSGWKRSKNFNVTKDGSGWAMGKGGVIEVDNDTRIEYHDTFRVDDKGNMYEAHTTFNDADHMNEKEPKHAYWNRDEDED